jgi:hypothetical protein
MAHSASDRRIAYNYDVFYHYFGVFNGMNERRESLTIYELKKFMQDHPTQEIAYEYSLLSLLVDFSIDKNGHLRARDAQNNLIIFDLEAEDYEFFIDNFYL